MTDLTG